MAGELTGRVAVVTGGGRGIGAAIARALAQAGAKVAVAGRNQAALDEVAREIGGLAVRCDVARAGEVTALASQVRAELGVPAIVVGNAGIARSAKFADTDEAAWHEVMDVNLTGAYRVAHAFTPDLLAAGGQGRLIFIASVAAKIGFSYTAAYCASKHGVLGLARALAHEWGPRGVTVNCVCPGWTDTDMAQAAVDNISARTGKDGRAQLAAMSPQRRLMEADEIAACVRYLASDAARGVNGQGINVDGGEVMS
jgi:NAD(P)-dependent dehydrogenase (short-subunit alcohol dehydrogenase family)